MLTADAFGILPPIARLTRDQALYYFLSGFTAKLAGTEMGVTEPQPTFSTCFGAPFLPQPPAVYARMLGRKLDEHSATVWLVNTGWTGGPFGEGHRMPIQATRRLLHAALSGELDAVDYRVDEIFGFDVPVEVPGVEGSLLDPRSTWSDPAAYDAKAHELAGMFTANFEKFAADAGEAITARRAESALTGPRRRRHRVGFRSHGAFLRRPRRRRRVRRHACRHRGARPGREGRRHLEAASDAQSLRRGGGWHQRRPRQQGRGQPREARVRHGQGIRLPGRPGRDRDLHGRGARRHLPARALGLRVLAQPRRAARPATVRCRRLATYRLRGRHHRARPDPGALRAAAEADGRRHGRLRGVLRVPARDRRRPLHRRHLVGPDERRRQAPHRASP